MVGAVWTHSRWGGSCWNVEWRKCRFTKPTETYSFSDIAIILDNPRSENRNLDVVCDIQEDGEIVALHSREDNLADNNSDEEWEDNRAAIDVIQEIDEFDSERNLN